MTQPRIKSQIRVQSWVRQCAAQGLMAVVVRVGEEESGAICLKVNRFAGGCDVYVAVTAEDGSSAWMQAVSTGRESEADAYIARQVKVDADLWVVEIEDPKGQFVMSERVVTLGK